MCSRKPLWAKSMCRWHRPRVQCCWGDRGGKTRVGQNWQQGWLQKKWQQGWLQIRKSNHSSPHPYTTSMFICKYWIVLNLYQIQQLIQMFATKIGDYICRLCKEVYTDAFGLAQHRLNNNNNKQTITMLITTRGCSHIMPAKFWHFWTPPPPVSAIVIYCLTPLH